MQKEARAHDIHTHKHTRTHMHTSGIPTEAKPASVLVEQPSFPAPRPCRNYCIYT